MNVKRYLITGGTGSWGNELVKQLLQRHDTSSITVLSRNEYNQVQMQRKFNIASDILKFKIGDIRDYEAVYSACEGIDVVFHLAALKHVPICEEMPTEAIKTNIAGTECLIRASIAQRVSKVIDVSTDKACSPNNLYGMTKAVGEKLILNANGKSKTKFTCIRAGNVLGSAGSVVPFFIQQIKDDNTLKLTDGNMTRYFMTLPEAICLLLVAMDFEADMFVMKMPSCTIRDLAEVMKDIYGNSTTNIIETGIRLGEKLHEMLINEHEAINTYKHGDNYFKITDKKYAEGKVDFKYYSSDSQPLMSKRDILVMLKKGGF